ncbi:MAG: 50S ribosomal protein L24 [Oscillospiraceae bacterium]|jgi:large subunit ribosomal protein L24|nr:50S ribosomal protein L24 [Oscillospiraceae bacterium]
MNRSHVKKGDTVAIISGKEKGKRGKILEISKKEKKVIVAGCNIATKHIKPRKQGETGGIAKVEAPLYICKVMPVCPKCKKPTRVGYMLPEGGKKQRICRHKNCGGTF